MTENDKVIITKSKINSIVNAIHYKNKESDGYTLDQMPAKIKAISSGAGGTGVSVTITTETENFYGKTVTLTDGENTMTASFSDEGVAVFGGVEMEGELTASVTVDGQTYSTTVEVQMHYNIELIDAPKVYGVAWDGTSSQVLVRTDDAVGLADPVAAINNGDGSSPFDNIYPWSQMTIVEDPIGGTMVKIPKFYYKSGKNGSNGIYIKISKDPIEGFSICPACADRGDGKGERDYILVGRYLCSEAAKSQSGVKPDYARLISDYRTRLHSIGNEFWQYDISTHATIKMLYLVEYAHWNSQEKIGFGCGDGGSNTGSTDNMVYHTGTTGATRNTKSFIQYRHIEDLWSNGEFFCDGVKIASDRWMYAQKNPANYSSSSYENIYSQYANIGINNYRYITKMGFADKEGYTWFMYPIEASDGSATSYIGDVAYRYTEGNESAILTVGGASSAEGFSGLFCEDLLPSGTPYHYLCSRLMKLP